MVVNCCRRQPDVISFSARHRQKILVDLGGQWRDGRFDREPPERADQKHCGHQHPRRLKHVRPHDPHQPWPSPLPGGAGGGQAARG